MSAPSSQSPDSNANASESRSFQRSFGEELSTTLNLDLWSTGVDWERAVLRFKEEISYAVAREERVQRTIREKVLPFLGTRDGLPVEAGVYRATPEELIAVHEGLLFPGRVEAIDGTSVTYDTLPIGITQIGIAVVSYGGTSATFSQRIFRKELTSHAEDALKEALELIGRRDHMSGLGQSEGLSELARRGIMTYAERKVLIDKSSSEWRMGHGNPCPYELLTGSGQMALLEASIDVMKRLINYEKFVFVPSSPNERGLLTLGNALAAGEYAILDSITNKCLQIVDAGHYKEEYKELATSFVTGNCGNVLYGLFKASDHSPPYLFYAHRNHVHMAARVAMADSILRPERGFPMLIDVADVTCRSAFGMDGFMGLIHNAYTQAGTSLKYFSERDTRR